IGPVSCMYCRARQRKPYELSSARLEKATAVNRFRMMTTGGRSVAMPGSFTLSVERTNETCARIDPWSSGWCADWLHGVGATGQRSAGPRNPAGGEAGGDSAAAAGDDGFW